MGLPGAGKTTLAQHLLELLERADMKCIWINADRVRQEYDDWDFSTEGRIRQSKRMRELADKIECDYVICDFVCPLPEMRVNFAADYTVWVDTISEGRYNDTNHIFVKPEIGEYQFRITEQDAPAMSGLVARTILHNETKIHRIIHELGDQHGPT